MKLQAESISRQIRGWANALQNTDIQGQRHLTDRSKQLYKKEKERKEFIETLEKYWQAKK